MDGPKLVIPFIDGPKLVMLFQDFWAMAARAIKISVDSSWDFPQRCVFLESTCMTSQHHVCEICTNMTVWS